MSIDVCGYTVNLEKDIGRGAFGIVYKGVNTFNYELVAGKKIPKSHGKMASTESILGHTIMENIHYKHIIEVIDIKSKDEAMWIFMEYCDLGDLSNFFCRNEHITNDPDSKIKLMKQIINGIVYLHSKDFVHRDIKPGNILLKSNPDGDILVKLGDFGLSRFLDPDGSTSAMSSNVGTSAFKAPEFWEPQEGGRISYHRSVDIYAAGITFAAMLQATKGRGLVPKIEGSLHQVMGAENDQLHCEDVHGSEGKMPIGLAMYNRKLLKQTAIVLISPKPGDSENIRKTKELIQDMTIADAKKRPDASHVQTRLQPLHETDASGLVPLFDGYGIEFLKQFGTGSFGTVYHGYKDWDVFAVKEITQENGGSEDFKLKQLRKNLVNHENIIKTSEIKYWNQSIWIVMEYCDLGNLEKYCQANSNTMCIHEKVRFMKQCMKGLTYLHRQRIIHRDIKPANLLLSSRGTRVTLKLADFGLCKILGPDDGSTMSSSVGTNYFKGPEFWDPNSNNRIRYLNNSNVDVYAAGLTFTAMLQAKQGKRLIPKAEGALQESEAAMQIGLAAQTRLIHGQPDISIVEDRPSDCNVTRQVKALIRRMTRVWPDNRIASEDAEKQLNSMCFGIMLNRRHFIQGQNHSICLSGSLVVMGGYSEGKRYISALEVPTGEGRISWWTNCPHFESFGPLVPFGSHGQFILEGCQTCSQIRCHDVREKRFEVIVDNVPVSTLCTGPGDTILGVLSGGNTIVHLEQAYLNGRFEEINRITSEVDHIVGLQYFPTSDTLVLAGKSKLQGILLSKENVLWRWNDKLCNIPLSPRGVMRSFPDDWLCVANGNGVLIIKPDGALCEQILNKENICSAAWCHDVMATLSIDGTVTIYNITFENSVQEYPCCQLPPAAVEYSQE